MIVSFTIERPPAKKTSLLSNDNSLNLGPIIGSKVAPEPLPPVISIEITLSISKSWGSTKTSLTDPLIIGSTSAVTPNPTLSSINSLGGFTTSYPSPLLKVSILDNGP